MVYVLDSSILISSKRNDFRPEEKTGFWQWLVELGKEGMIIIPERVYEELGAGTDELPGWLDKHKSLFWKPSSICRNEQAMVIHAYESIWETPPPKHILSRLGADPYVIAHALAAQGTVVANEGRTGSKVDVKIPVVCDRLSLPCISLARFLWNLRNRLPD